MSVCLSVTVRNIHFQVLWRPLVKECIPNIGHTVKKNAAYAQQSALLYVYDIRPKMVKRAKTIKTVNSRQKWTKPVKNCQTPSKTVKNGQQRSTTFNTVENGQNQLKTGKNVQNNFQKGTNRDKNGQKRFF